MSDARDAVAEALVLNRKLAASLLVKKQELEAELAAGPAAARAELLASELADVESGYRDALAEMAELRRLGEQARANVARAVVADSLASDPVLTSHEDRALAAAREHIRELEALASLGDQPAERAAPAARKSREETEQEARAEFEALRARRAGESAPEPASRPARPKKTL